MIIDEASQKATEDFGSPTYRYIQPFEGKHLMHGMVGPFHNPQRIVQGIVRESETQPKQFKLSDFYHIEKIGEGTFGKVYKAEYRDPITKEVTFYALKKLNMLMEEM